MPVPDWRLNPNSWVVRNGWWVGPLIVAAAIGLAVTVTNTSPPATLVHVVPTFDHPSSTRRSVAAVWRVYSKMASTHTRLRQVPIGYQTLVRGSSPQAPTRCQREGPSGRSVGTEPAQGGSRDGWVVVAKGLGGVGTRRRRANAYSSGR